MATTWLKRAASVLEREFPGLPAGPILWRSIFQGQFGKVEIEGKEMSYTDARGFVATTTDPLTNTITLDVAAGFEQAFFNIENVAERAIVDGLVEGAAQLSSATSLARSSRRPLLLGENGAR
jgi:hypothetical protein